MEEKKKSASSKGKKQIKENENKKDNVTSKNSIKSENSTTNKKNKQEEVKKSQNNTKEKNKVDKKNDTKKVKDEQSEETEKDNIESKKKKEEITKEKLDKIEEELKTSKKNKTKNSKLLKDVTRNILIAIVITIYFLFIGLGVKTIPITEYSLDLKTFSIFTIIIAIIIFEKAYKKDQSYLAIHGIEMIALGIETLVLLNLYSLENNYFEYTLYGIIAGMFTYYLFKTLIIVIKEKVNINK